MTTAQILAALPENATLVATCWSNFYRCSLVDWVVGGDTFSAKIVGGKLVEVANKTAIFAQRAA